MKEHIVTNSVGSVAEAVIEFITDFSGEDENEITPQTHLERDLGLDSLDRIELEVAIELRFKISIPVSKSPTLCTVQGYIEEVEDRS